MQDWNKWVITLSFHGFVCFAGSLNGALWELLIFCELNRLLLLQLKTGLINDLKFQKPTCTSFLGLL